MLKKMEHYNRLDYLRILSCIMVLLYHLNILKGGFLAVCTFFVLSGYLECVSALKKDYFSIKSYYINRFKKIYLPLLIVVFITIIIFKLHPFTNWMNLKPESLSVILGYNNFWQLNANLDYFTKHINSPFMHFWYISILIQFDLIFPILFSLLKKIDIAFRKDISIIIVIIATIISTITFIVMSITQEKMIVYYNTFARSFSFLFGILLALLHYKYNFKISRIFRNLHTPIYAIYSILLIAMCLFVSSKSNNYSIFMILSTIISCRIIEYSIEKTSKNNNKLIELISKQTYGIYLIQYPVIFFLSNNSIIANILVILITFVLSCILNLLITKPKIKEIIICICIIVTGSIVLILQKDYSNEMRELEDKLNENQRISDEQKSRFLNSTNTEQEEKNDKEEQQKTETLEEAKIRIAEEVSQLPIIGVGDSVLLGVADSLYEQFPNGYFDGKVSRTIDGGKEVLQDLINQGKLSNTVVLALANNGDYAEWKNESLMELLGNREVYWVNAVGADDPEFNSRFKEFAQNYPNIHIIEWDVVSENHPEYFYPDGIHLNPDGIKPYVNAIYEAIYNNYLEKYKNNN